MPNVSKAIRDAVKTALAHNSTGFNPTLAAIAASYGITAFTIDFGTTSANFLMAHLTTAEQLEMSYLSTLPGMAVYTPGLQYEGVERPRVVSGVIGTNVDLYYSAAGMEPRTAEQALDAVEDALITVLQRKPFPWPPGFSFSGFQISRDPIIQAGDDWVQRLSYQMVFRVNI